ncbi:hypothetical protein GWI33_018587 [Rhynchophorus ferrugineus]|uniref:Uncharacterized protein n=1 Tax=Rhynchophorus ferrugineus TaxID=354439 RepID=A0A834M646_RHYFE|nr:hypothetical protein GWI33_018587 [Rhynchophorus ferrugineus]
MSQYYQTDAIVPGNPDAKTDNPAVLFRCFPYRRRSGPDNTGNKHENIYEQNSQRHIPGETSNIVKFPPPRVRLHQLCAPFTIK